MVRRVPGRRSRPIFQANPVKMRLLPPGVKSNVAGGPDHATTLGAMDDLRHALRILRASPGFAALAILTLAAGIVANTVIFSIVSAVLLQPLPYGEPDRLVMVWETSTDRQRAPDAVSPANFLDLADADTGLGAMAAWFETARTLHGGDGAEQVNSAQVTTAFFDVLQVRAARGQLFSAGTAGAALDGTGQYHAGDRVVVISDGLWRRRFGARPDVVGETISINHAPWRIVGVLTPGFALPSPGIDLWMPWDAAASLSRGNTRDARFVHVVARLRPGLTLDQAAARLAAVYAGLAEAHPKENRGWSTLLTPLREEVVGAARPGLIAMFGAVALILLIACANVASLLLARAAVRRREVAIRTALGASRIRIVRQLVVESLTLALIAGAVAVLITSPGLDAVRALAPPGIPRLDEATVDLRVWLFALGVSMLTGLAFGLVPALRGTSTRMTAALRDGGTRTATSGAVQRVQSATVVAEVALALVLVTGAGLAARSFQALLSVEPGFDTSRLVTMHITLDSTAYAGKAAAYFRDLTTRLASLPGAESAAAVSTLPLSHVGVDFDRPYWRDGDPEPGGEADKVAIRMSTPGFFRTMSIPLVRGREFTDEDQRDTPAVLIVSEAFARRTWGSAEEALGRRLVIDYNRGKYAYQVVGVTRDVRYYGPRRAPRPEVYIPHAQNAYLPMNVVVRTIGEPASLTGAVLDTVRAMDPAQPAHHLRTMDQLLAVTLATDRFVTWLFLGLATLALTLAATGVYGLMSYVVAQRTQEAGIRMALGARPRDVVQLLVRQSLALTLAGVVVGGLCAFALTRVLAGVLFEVSPTDPATFVASAVLLTGVGMVAAWLPARRAVHIDPTRALRHE